MLVDSHTHLYLEEFKDDIEAVMDRASESGVGHFMFPNVDLSTIEPMKRLAGRYNGLVDMAIGLHPTEVNENWVDAINIIENEAETGLYKAIGEIGIDLYWDKSFLEQQLTVFKLQCELSCKLDLPVIIHCREGLAEILSVFDTLPVLPRGVFPEIGVDRLLLETDAPYLAPVPKRGKRNESGFLIHTAGYVANELRIDTDKLGEMTTENYYRLFGKQIN